MLTELAIPRTPQRTAALDMEQLYQRGLERIRKLAGAEWTDHNIHDPGITLLEALCFALTDLGYRTELPLEDLLAAPAGDKAADWQQPFFTAREILHNRPLTAADYRRLLIDLPRVRNAWIQPAALRYYADTHRQKLMEKDDGSPGVVPVDVMGLYDVLIDYEDGLSQAEQQDVKNAVLQVLHDNRGLCEDFSDPKPVYRQNFVLCAEIELEAGADISEVGALILFEVQRHLAPPVTNYSLAEMMARQKADGGRYTVDEIFAGPPLKHGFIPEEELARAELREEIRLSDVISIVMDIEGVRAVRNALINRSGETEPLENPWTVPVMRGRKASLDMDGCRLVFYKQDLPVTGNSSRMKESFRDLVNEEQAKSETEKVNDLGIPGGRFRDPAAYQTVQNHLPEVYGVSDAGLPASASPQRVAQARQLQAWLLFFDQLMANFLAQLADFPRLFSTDPTRLRTYAYQVVERLSEFYRDDASAAIESAMIDRDIQVRRRNRMLDHLIARFSEQFGQFAQTMLSVFEMRPADLVRYRCDFLQTYPGISSARGRAYDYTRSGAHDVWDSTNVSGLEFRLCKLLGIADCRRRNLADVVFDEFAEVFATAAGKFRFRIRDHADNRILIRSNKNFATEAEARVALRQAVQAASLPGGFVREVDAGGKFRFNVADAADGLLALGNEVFETAEDRDAAIDGLMLRMRERYSDEGMYVVEKILLRPDLALGDPFLEICVDPGCEECPETDPYSYRLQIVLPAYGARFGNMEFRNYAEQVIRAEVPAHILPRICWVDRASMAEFESAYRGWLELKSGQVSSGRTARLEQFKDWLRGVRNVYPVERLHRCGEDDSKPKFIVGKRALGSMNTD